MRRKPARIFLIIAISLYILVSSTYGQYYCLAAADFISHQLKLENFDQEYLSASNQSELKVYGSGRPFNGSQLATYLIGLPSHLFSQIPSFDQKTLILRC
jgi:hypothetical protein